MGGEMLLVLIALANLILAGLGFTLIFNSVTVPEPIEILFIGLIGSFLYYGYRMLTEERHKRADQLMIFVLSCNLALFLSSVLYSVWTFDKMFSALALTKVILFLLFLLVVYANALYIRAVTSYKKKRGNQRIKSEKEPNLFTQIFRKKTDAAKSEVYLTLGEVADNTDD